MTRTAALPGMPGEAAAASVSPPAAEWESSGIATTAPEEKSEADDSVGEPSPDESSSFSDSQVEQVAAEESPAHTTAGATTQDPTTSGETVGDLEAEESRALGAVAEQEASSATADAYGVPDAYGSADSAANSSTGDYGAYDAGGQSAASFDTPASSTDAYASESSPVMAAAVGGTTTPDASADEEAAESQRRGWRREDELPADAATPATTGTLTTLATPPSTMPPEAEAVPHAGGSIGHADLSRVERLLEQLLEETRRREDLVDSDFSVSKLMAGITQVLALAALFWAYFNQGNYNNLQTTLMVGLVLQTLTISLLIMGRQR